MKLISKIKEGARQGVQVSKEVLGKAQHTADNLGKIGILRVELRDLSSRIKKEENRLGHRVRELLGSGERQSVSMKTPGIKEIFDTLEQLNTDYAAKEKELDEQDQPGSYS